MTIDTIAVRCGAIDMSAASVTATLVGFIGETKGALARFAAIQVFDTRALETSKDGAGRRVQRAIVP
jgi:hypothetical protein